MIYPSVAVRNDSMLVKDAKIELRGQDGVLHDVSACVRSIKMDLTVGQLGRATIETFPLEAEVSEMRLDERAEFLAACQRAILALSTDVIPVVRTKLWGNEAEGYVIVLECVCGAAVNYPGHPDSTTTVPCESCHREYTVVAAQPET